MTYTVLIVIYKLSIDVCERKQLQYDSYDAMNDAVCVYIHNCPLQDGMDWFQSLKEEDEEERELPKEAE